MRFIWTFSNEKGNFYHFNSLKSYGFINNHTRKQSENHISFLQTNLLHLICVMFCDSTKLYQINEVQWSRTSHQIRLWILKGLNFYIYFIWVQAQKLFDAKVVQYSNTIYRLFAISLPNCHISTDIAKFGNKISKKPQIVLLYCFISRSSGSRYKDNIGPIAI